MNYGNDNFSDSGFTFIEILVVLIITTALLSLVTPNLFHSYDKIKASTEEQRLIDLIENIKMKAFLRKVSYTLVFNDNVLYVKNHKLRVSFQFIQFPSCSLVFNRNGFSNVNILKYVALGKQKNLDVWP